METELLQSLKLNFSFLDIFLYPIVIWNNDKLIVYCNSYFQKLTEYSKEEIENKMSIEDFISGKFINAKNEGNISQIIATIYINKEKKKRNFFIIDNKINENLNLSIIVDSINGKPILDNNQFINDIFLSIPDIMFVVNKSLIVEYVNYKNSDLNLRNPSEIENKHIDNLKLPKAIIKKYKKQLEKTEDNPSCENYQLVLNKRLFYFKIRIIKSNSKYISIVRDVSKMVEYENKIKFQNDRMHNLLENIPLFVLEINDSGRVIFSNGSFQKLLKYCRIKDKNNFISVIGKSNFEILFRDQILNQVKILDRYFKISLTSNGDNYRTYVVLLHEITEEIINKQKAEELESNFKYLVENSPSGLVLKDGPKIIYANNRVKEMFDIKDLQKFDFTKFFSVEDLFSIENRCSDAREGKEVPAKEYTVNFSNGTQKIIKTKQIVVSYMGALVNQIILDDISLEKQLEKESFEKRVILEINSNLQNEIDQRLIIQDELKKSINDKQILLKEIHHRVKNNFQIISSLINNKINFLSNENDKLLFKAVIQRIKSMALVHDYFYKADNFSSINLVDYLRGIYMSYLRNLSANNNNFITKYKTRLQNILVSVDEAISIGLLFNEVFVISTSINTQNLNINCTFVELKNAGKDTLCLSISSEFFKQFDSEKALSQAVDFYIIEVLVEQLNGEIELKENVLNLFLKMKLTKTK